MSPSGAAGAGGGILGSLIGGFMGQNQSDWLKNALMQVYQQQQAAQNFGINYGQSQFNPASASAQGLTGAASQLLFGHDGQAGSMTGLQDALQAAMGGIGQGQFQGSGITPQMQQVLDAMGGTAGSNSGTADLLRNVIANGGGSTQSQSIWNNLNNLATGQGANNSALSSAAYKLLTNPQSQFTTDLQGAGQNSVNNGGMTDTLKGALSSLQYIANQGGSNSNMDSGVAQALQMLNGSNPYSSMLSGAAQNGLASNLGVAGLTNTGAQGETAALGGINNQGATQDSNFFANRGQQLASQDAVLPAMLTASMARNQAGTDWKNAAEAAQAKALARGGGPGSLVANGTTNQALADFADQGAQGVSKAGQDALINSQGLNLQQQQQGAQMGLQGGQLQLGNLNNYSSLLQGLENDATQRYGVGGNMAGQAGSLANQTSNTGFAGLNNLSSLQSQNMMQALGQMNGIQNSATNNAGTLGNLGLGGGQLQLGNQTLGGSLTNQLNNTSLAGLQGLQGNLNQANNYTLGASGALNNFSGTQGSLLNSIFGNNLGAGQLGTSQTSNYYNALNSLFGQGNTLSNNQVGMSGQGLNTLLGIGNAGFGYANNALSGLGNIFKNYQPGNSAGQGIAGATGGIGSLLGALGL